MYRQKIRAFAREASFPIESYGTDHFVLTAQMIGELRVKSYLEQWQAALENKWFHIKMEDHSLFLFNEGTSPSYSFIHCPLDVITFNDFLKSLGQENNPSNRRRLGTQYAEVLETASERRHVTPIRFDYDENGYRPGVHPVAHIHVGLSNQVRISTNKMSAVSFVLFVMRHMYPSCWETLLARSSMRSFVSSIREPSTKVPQKYWDALDEVELHFR
jgi:hypothetical protein